MRKIATVLICIFTLTSIAKGQAVFTEVSKPTAKVLPGAVYGYVTYKLTNFTEAQYTDWLNKIAQKLGNNEREYIITLEIKRTDETVVAREIIAHVTVNQQKYLWIFKKSYQEMQSRKWAGFLAENLVTNDANNTLKVSIKAYYTDKTSVDAVQFQELVKASNTANLISLTTPAIAAAKGTVDFFADLLGKILSRYAKIEITDQYSMSFTKIGDKESFPNRVRLSAFGQPKQFLEVYFGTASTRLTGIFDVATQKFVTPTVNYFLSNPKINGKTPLEIINSSSEPEIKSFLDALKAPLEKVDGKTPEPKNKISNIEDKCRRIFRAFSEVLAVRDATAVYWAWLHANDDSIATRADDPKSCLDKFDREVMERLGLSTDDLLK